MHAGRLLAAVACTVFLTGALGPVASAGLGRPASPGPASAPSPPVNSPAPAVAPTANVQRGAQAVDAARKRVAAGDLAGAVDALAAYVAANPRELAPARYLGDLEARRGNPAAAERAYRAILRIDPADRATHDRLGGLYASQDRLSDAIDEFTKSLPNSSAYGHLIDLHRRRGDLTSFVAGFARAAFDQPQDGAAQYAYGTIERALHKPADALPYLERAARLTPHACPALSELGSANLDLGRTAPAVAALRRCLEHDPDDYAANVNLGDADVTTGDLADARAAFERANRARPDAAEAIVDLGYLEDLQSNWQSAVEHYLRAITYDPLVPEAYVDLGYDYDEHRLFALAEAAYLKGISVSPDDGRLHYLLGVTYVHQGKRDLARAEFERASHSEDAEIARAAAHDLAHLPGQ